MKKTLLHHQCALPLSTLLSLIVGLGVLSGCSSNSADTSSPSPPRINGQDMIDTESEEVGDPSLPDPAEGDTPGVDENPVDAPDTPPVDGTDTFSDEFDVDSLANWSRRHQLEGTAAQYTLLDINRTVSGALTLQPTLTPGWFADGDAPLIFKSISGNFAVETEVLVESLSGNGLAPDANFNSAGLMARDPAGDTGPENHVMVNIGTQDSRISGSVGSETKSTRNSASRLMLQAGTNRGRLILCRVGESFTSYRLLDNETSWTRIGTVDRPDLPEQLQVGIVANGFTGPDVRAYFDYIRLRVPVTENNCTPTQ